MAQDISAAERRALIPPAALACVPGCETGVLPRSVVALDGGTLNASFRIETRAGLFLLRLNSQDGAALGADHLRESRLQVAAARAGVAPDLIYADPAERFLVMKFVAGECWSAADFGRGEQLERLGARLRVLHCLQPPAVRPFDLAAVLRDHSARLSEAQPADKNLFAMLGKRSEVALVECGGGARRATIVHNDLHHSNVIEAERLYLIDWEYAAVADPLFDLACIIAYYPEAGRHGQLLLDAAGLGAQASPEALTAASVLFMHVSYLWLRLRRLGDPTAADMAAEDALLRRLIA